MSAVAVTSLSSKGQIVIPNAIRSELDVSAGAKFAVICDGKHILLKPIERPRIAAFNRLIARSRSYARKHRLTQKDLAKAITEVRRENRN